MCWSVHSCNVSTHYSKSVVHARWGSITKAWPWSRQNDLYLLNHEKWIGKGRRAEKLDSVDLTITHARIYLAWLKYHSGNLDAEKTKYSLLEDATSTLRGTLCVHFYLHERVCVQDVNWFAFNCAFHECHVHSNYLYAGKVLENWKGTFTTYMYMYVCTAMNTLCITVCDLTCAYHAHLTGAPLFRWTEGCSREADNSRGRDVQD